jgi:adenylyltransferase/sulfurtransferase
MTNEAPSHAPIAPVAQPREVAARMLGGESLRLLDVREPGENAFVALPGSTLIPLGELAARVHEIDAWAGQEFIVYCHHGVRSGHAVAWLRSQGFHGARNLSGGMDRWSLEIDAGVRRYS